MALADRDEEGGGIPEWVVTFGDMMSLLLTFFIMLVSMSEIKDEERYQMIVESLTRRFGYDTSVIGMAPGPIPPRNAMVAKLATDGRARREKVTVGGDKTPAAVGDFPRVRIIRPGEKTSIGTVIFFDEFSDELTPQSRLALQETAATLQGKPQKIEIRGHSSFRPLPENAPFADHWQLAYQRCRATFRYLTEQQGIDPRRIRIAVAGPNEPMHIGSAPVALSGNPRVEVFALDEIVSDLMGTQEEQKARYTDGDVH